MSHGRGLNTLHKHQCTHMPTPKGKLKRRRYKDTKKSENVSILSLGGAVSSLTPHGKKG